MFPFTFRSDMHARWVKTEHSAKETAFSSLVFSKLHLQYNHIQAVCCRNKVRGDIPLVDMRRDPCTLCGSSNALQG